MQICIYLYIYIYIYMHVHIYIIIKTYIFILLSKNNSNNVNHKNNNSNSNERKWSYCLKQILLLACKFYIICIDIQRLPNSLFLIWRSQGSLIVSIPLVLNPIFLGLKTITIQYCDIQSALNVFQKYRFCEDYTNIFWTEMFLLEILETNFGEF